ncbi:MAG: tetratricopeptide repeat protein [Chloroflexi bacterium]|nr:tetratricopeptide repeat protein [Chloroflexota bacterium]
MRHGTSRPLTDDAGNPIVLLDVEEERRRVRAALQSAHIAADVEYVPHATTGAVKTALRDAWDVVHFTGHGTADGRLLLENEFGEAHALAPSETAQLFSECRARLIVLSACHSESIARALHAAGVPALIAIDARVPIADRAATIFAEHFYGALARGWEIRKAFDDAQESVALDDAVGDATFTPTPSPSPVFDRGEELPWSQRFTLIGDDVGAFNKTPLQTPLQTPTPDEPRVIGNLRARNANFVGRAKEIVEIVKTLDGRGVLSNAPTPRVAIIGAGGIGKTELAQAIAWWYVERGKADAVLWSSASRDEGEFVLRDLGSLLSIAARAFGLPITEQSSFDEQKRVVREFCAAHRAIVLLDNWETLEPRARKEVWDFVKNFSDPSTSLRAGTTRVIITSRDTLPPKDARNYELDTLTLADGAQLFLNIARNAGYFDRNPKLSKEDAAILSAIVERLGGYPLAIEVVAGQTESRALDAIWRDLVQIPQNVLEGKDELTGEPRGVWTSLGFSYDVLPAPAQSLFRQMGVLLAPAAVEDVAAITQTSEVSETSEVSTRLDMLVRRSLVRMREGAYALLPMVREYALSKLADAGGDPRELHTRAVNHYAEKKTLAAALNASEHLFELAARFQSREAAEAFVNYARGFYQELVTRGYWAEARRKAEQLIAVARVLGDKMTEAQAIGELGSRFYQIGEYERATELHKQAQKTLAESGDKRGVATALHQQGILAQEQGNYAEAVRLYRESMNLKEELGDKRGIAQALHQLGMLAQDQGNYAEAVRLYRESMKIAGELGDKRGIAQTLHQLGNVEYQQGNYAEAVRLYRESMKIEEELGNKQGIAQTLHQLGVLAQEQGNYVEARRLYRESMKLEKELGSKQGIAQSLHQLGVLAQRQGNYAEAGRLYRESMKLEEELGGKSGIANALGQLGNLAISQGDYAQARAHYGEALELFKELEDKRGIARTLHNLAVLAQNQRDYAEAVRLYRESMKLKEELGDKSGMAGTLYQIGTILQRNKNFKDALRNFLIAAQIASELKHSNLPMAIARINGIKKEVGEKQFEDWVREMTTDKIGLNGQTSNS